jgi:hypothetical protein
MKPIIVTVTETRHKSQPWKFVIDKPGPKAKETKHERYATASSAVRGAMRVIGATYFPFEIYGYAKKGWSVWDDRSLKRRYINVVKVYLKKKKNAA